MFGSAAPHLAAAIRHYQNLGHFEGLTRCLAALSALALQQGDPHLAARLIGTAAEVRDRFGGSGLRPWPWAAQAEQPTIEQAKGLMPEEIEVMLAMNRLRHAYLEIAPGLEPYFTTGHHDDAPGLAASFLLPKNPGRLGPWGYFLVNTPTVLATVDAALAAAVVVLAGRQAGAPATVAVVMAAAAFLLVWAGLVSWERRTLDPVARTTPRFPIPPDHS